MAFLITLTGACKRETDQKLELGKIIARTEHKSRKFVYVDATRQTKTQVAGVIEDDFRYRTRLTVNGSAIEDEVTSDDTLALRFVDPAQMPNYLVANNVVGATASGGVPVVGALQTQHWVLDKTGAPKLQQSASDTRKQGDDPVFDSLTALEYVRRAVNTAVFVKIYKRDDVDPTFKAKEDPFPQPAKSSKTKRYDLKPPPLPRADAATSGGNQQPPSLANFRKMVVYVQDKTIVEVREVIDVQSKLDDLIATFKLPKNVTAADAAFAINAVRRGQGDEVIRLRTMTLRFENLGDALKVELPADAVTGSLSVVRYRGRGATTAAGGTTTPSS
jgi:hypothetical protein